MQACLAFLEQSQLFLGLFRSFFCWLHLRKVDNDQPSKLPKLIWTFFEELGGNLMLSSSPMKSSSFSRENSWKIVVGTKYGRNCREADQESRCSDERWFFCSDESVKDDYNNYNDHPNNHLLWLESKSNLGKRDGGLSRLCVPNKKSLLS